MDRISDSGSDDTRSIRVGGTDLDKAEAKYLKMTTEPVRKLVCGFAVPSIVCMLVTSIYNMADTYFVSRLNTQSVAAVGILFSYMGIIQAMSFFFGHGSGNYISRALGARKTDDARKMVSTGLLTAMSVSVLIAVVSALFRDPFLRLLGSTPTILPYARSYFFYLILGTPFISGSLVLNNQMRLQGNAMMSMAGILSGCCLNMLLDPLFIFGFGMGVSGAGLATAVSQMTSFFILLNLSGRRGGIKVCISSFTPTSAMYKEIAAGGLPSLARQGLMFLSIMCLNNLAKNYGDASVAAFSVVSRVMSIANSIMIGFGQGFQPVCGFNFGARKYGRVRSALGFCIVVATVFCASVAVLGYVFAPEIISVFDSSSDGGIMAMGTRIMRYQCLAYPLAGVIVMTNMFLQNIRKTIPAVIVAASRQGLFFIPFVCLGTLLFGVRGLMLAQPFSDLCAFIVALPILAANVKGLGSTSSSAQAS